MDLLIFTKAPSAYEPTRYKEEADKLGLKSEIVTYSDLDFIISQDGVQILWKKEAIPTPKAVIFRAAGNDDFYIPQRDYMIDWFRDKGTTVLNAETYKKWSRLDKITQHLEFQKAGLPFIDSEVFGSNERFLNNASGYPKILKKNLSSRGRDVFKISKNDEAKQLFDQGYFARTMLLQPFLKIGQDLRIIVVGGEVIGAMKRVAKPGQYLTNFSQGGMVEDYDIKSDPEALSIAKKTAKHFNLDYVGVDLMMADDGKWKVLEVNRACQFKGFELSTKVNVPLRVMKFFKIV